MTESTKIALALLALFALVFVWLGGTAVCVAYACLPGCAGAILLAGLVFLSGWGFFQEARSALAGFVG